MKKSLVWLVPVILAVLLSGCGGEKADDVREPDPIPVRVEEALTGNISETVGFSGEVAAGSEVQVVPKTSGRVVRVVVSVGQEVKQGDLLIELEAQELAAALRQAEAGLEIARANLKSAQSGGTLAQLQASKQQSEANYINAKVNFERMDSLYVQGGISLQQLDASRLQYQVAESQYNLAHEQLALFERGEGQAEILAAQVKQAEAGVEMARLNYNNSRITAPLDGVVAMLGAEVGTMVSPGIAVAAVVNVEGVSVTARLTEQTVGLVQQGMRVTVEIASLGESFDGEVREVAPSPLAGTKSFPVKVRLLDAEGVKPGMFARLLINTAASDDTVIVPRAAVLEQDGKHYLYTVKDGKAVRKNVVTGLYNENSIEIVSGLFVGEPVVTAGQHFLRDGSVVLVEEVDVR